MSEKNAKGGPSGDEPTQGHVAVAGRAEAAALALTRLVRALDAKTKLAFALLDEAREAEGALSRLKEAIAWLGNEELGAVVEKQRVQLSGDVWPNSTELEAWAEAWDAQAVALDALVYHRLAFSSTSLPFSSTSAACPNRHRGGPQCVQLAGHDAETPHLYRCAGPSCPGLPWPASEKAHPVRCLGQSEGDAA